MPVEKSVSAITPDILLPDDQHIVVIYNGEVAMVVTEIICLTIFGGVNIRKILKIKSFINQNTFAYPCFSLRIELCQYPSVFPENMIDISDKIGFILIQAVIIRIPALIGAEFFVNTPRKGISTFRTNLLHEANLQHFEKAQLSDRHLIY